MPASRAVLADIQEKGLDPAVAWTKSGKDGRLKSQPTSQSAIAETPPPVAAPVEPAMEELVPSAIIEVAPEKKEEQELSSEQLAVVQSVEPKKGKVGRKKKTAEDELIVH
jgi:hypothetical protein